MTWTRQVTLWCDSCGDWHQSSDLNVEETRIEAARLGWSRSGLRDVCPHCNGNCRSPICTHTPCLARQEEARR